MHNPLKRSNLSNASVYCKQLKETADGISAISFNRDYKPFQIDKNKQFAIVGQVISVVKKI